jgi:hypothetical protein
LIVGSILGSEVSPLLDGLALEQVDASIVQYLGMLDTANRQQEPRPDCD